MSGMAHCCDLKCFSAPLVSKDLVWNEETFRNGSHGQYELYVVVEPFPNEQTASAYSPETNLEWYQRFFSNRPLMRCLDTMDDTGLSHSVPEIVEESRSALRGRLTAQVDSSPADADSLYEMLLRETTQEVQQCHQESLRHEMEVSAWWDNIRAQLRDEGEPTSSFGQHRDRCNVEPNPTMLIIQGDNVHVDAKWTPRSRNSQS